MIYSFKMSEQTQRTETKDESTQCNICCGSNEQEKTSHVSSSSVITESNSSIHFCRVCGTADRIDGVPIGHHSDVFGECDPDRINLHNSEISWCNGCSTPDRIDGVPVGHHTDDYNCVPDPRFLRQSHYQGHFHQFEFVPVISGLFNDEVPCSECMEVMVPNPVNSDAIGCGYCENCWRRR